MGKPSNTKNAFEGFGAYAVAGQLNYTVVELNCKMVGQGKKENARGGRGRFRVNEAEQALSLRGRVHYSADTAEWHKWLCTFCDNGQPR